MTYRFIITEQGLRISLQVHGTIPELCQQYWRFCELEARGPSALLSDMEDKKLLQALQQAKQQAVDWLTELRAQTYTEAVDKTKVARNAGHRGKRLMRSVRDDCQHLATSVPAWEMAI